jgi:hypothetical protein
VIQPGAGSVAVSNSVSPIASPRRALLDKYCVTCHNGRLRTAGLTLDKIDVENISASAEVLEKIVRKVRSGDMPPPGLPRPDQTTLKAFAAALEAALDREAAVKPNPGRVAVHRLNQIEYTNAIRDLLALDIDGRSLLGTDDAGATGFDNMADALPVSPALLERYMVVARKISRLAVGDTAILPVFETYAVPDTLVQEERTSEDLPIGSHGGIAVHHRFAVDGEYEIKIRLQRQVYGYLIGMGRPHPLEVRLDGKLIKVLIAGGAPGKPAPASFAGNIPGDAEWELYMHNADDALDFRFHAHAGTRVVGISFADANAQPEGVAQPLQTEAFGLRFNERYEGQPGVKSVSIGGPFKVEGPGDTPSRRRLFICRPTNSAGENPCAKQILSTVARRAFRRPVTDTDIEPLLKLYETQRKQGNFETGIEFALQSILSDPDFLFRIERDPPKSGVGSVYRLSDIELASRLSFFLWSSIPDDELLDLAAREQLRVPQILAQQLRRMLADPRANMLADNFVSQWLGLTKLKGSVPDPGEFPGFNESLRNAFQQETRLFIESQLQEDRSVVDLLTANYTYVNEQLARHYGISNVYGDGLRRITFNDGIRGGLLGQASILTVTSYANRTSPVVRGKWLLENLLGSPPPPPPPNVPSLPETSASGSPKSVRERMEEHRKNPACAVCHVRMDPLGFALESFNAIGQWRTADKDGTPIDVVSTLPDGTKFDGVTSLRNFLLARREQYVQNVTAKLLAWAIGRNVEYYDMPAVREIMLEAAANDYRWTSLIEGIVKSVPFQSSIVESAPSAAVDDSRPARLSRKAFVNGEVVK